MQKSILSFVFMLFFSSGYSQSKPAVDLANKIADKMRDSLQLSQSQRQKIFTINIHLANEKQAAWKHLHNRDSIFQALQRIENKRDSLYKSALDNAKYGEYKLKKRRLVNNN